MLTPSLNQLKKPAVKTPSTDKSPVARATAAPPKKATVSKKPPNGLAKQDFKPQQAPKELKGGLKELASKAQGSNKHAQALQEATAQLNSAPRHTPTPAQPKTELPPLIDISAAPAPAAATTTAFNPKLQTQLDSLNEGLLATASKASPALQPSAAKPQAPLDAGPKTATPPQPQPAAHQPKTELPPLIDLAAAPAPSASTTTVFNPKLQAQLDSLNEGLLATASKASAPAPQASAEKPKDALDANSKTPSTAPALTDVSPKLKAEMDLRKGLLKTEMDLRKEHSATMQALRDTLMPAPQDHLSTTEQLAGWKARDQDRKLLNEELSKIKTPSAAIPKDDAAHVAMIATLQEQVTTLKSRLAERQQVQPKPKAPVDAAESKPVATGPAPAAQPTQTAKKSAAPSDAAKAEPSAASDPAAAKLHTEILEMITSMVKSDLVEALNEDHDMEDKPDKDPI